MATNPVNLVDAIGTVVPRLARNRSAVVRMGVIKSWPSNALVSVTVGGADITAAYGVWYLPYVGDVVALISDGDRWLVLGRIATTADANQMNYRNGHVDVGDPADTTAWLFRSYRNIDSKQYEINVFASSSNANGAGLQVLENGVLMAIFEVAADGQLWSYTGTGTKWRPVPFASQVGSTQFASDGKTYASVGVTYSAGRFTQEPCVQVTHMSSSTAVMSTKSFNGSTAGVTLGIACVSAMGANHYVHWHACQMTAGSTQGRAAEPPLTGDYVTLTCATTGCDNEGIPIEIRATVDVVDFACGVCAQPIPVQGIQRRK